MIASFKILTFTEDQNCTEPLRFWPTSPHLQIPNTGETEAQPSSQTGELEPQFLDSQVSELTH